MGKEWNIKHVVKVLFVTKPLQKIHFTVRHPETAIALTGIMVTTNNVSGGIKLDGYFFNEVTGVLSLSIPQRGDVFFSQEVFSEIPSYDKAILYELNAESLGDMQSSIRSKNDYFKTCIPVCEAMMEGYYEDVSFSRASVLAGPKLIEPMGIPVPSPVKSLYKITLYLRYELKVPETETKA